jgi:hypothetical protein
MPSEETNEQKQKATASSLLKDMEAIALRMRSLIVAMPPLDLLGYIYYQRVLKVFAEQNSADEEGDEPAPDDLINENQFLLEYVHAVLVSDISTDTSVFDEMACQELYSLGRRLREQALLYAMTTSVDTENKVFGPNTADIEFHAKSSWVILRGNRYPVLEGEFYRYVLAPHDDILTEVYGVGAVDIASGFQAMANAMRAGHANAITTIGNQLDAVMTFAATRNKTIEDVMEEWATQNADQVKISQQAIYDMIRGGVANVSLHTNLPPKLLADLAYQRGEETDFFAIGDYAGTPFRTLPARKKPLVQIGSDYYAVDPCFARDAGYRALLFNLLRHKPDYSITFNERQKVMSEAAFADILRTQLPGAKVFQEIYYKNPKNKQWAENDTLILFEDMLFLVEAKAGAAATIASPALDFDRHTQSVQELFIKAYNQCKRAFDYLSSADEIVFYHLRDGKHVECVRIKHANFRVMIPIGLTVESFAPFSTYCKELPQIEPLLGKHGFWSISIDDLFVLNRLLPTPGEFCHYMVVRQAIAGLRGARLFDEIDHLGAYLKNNRFDMYMRDQLKSDENTIVIWNDMCHEIDRSFEGENWERGPFPNQNIPEELLKVVQALDNSREPGWIFAERCIRDLGEEGRNELDAMLTKLRKSLNQHPVRYFFYGSVPPLFFWLQKSSKKIDWLEIHNKASAAALLNPTTNLTGIVLLATAGGIYKLARTFEVIKPQARIDSNTHIYDDADRMNKRAQVHSEPSAVRLPKVPRAANKSGRNDPCPCNSGLKYKKCHGR